MQEIHISNIENLKLRQSDSQVTLCADRAIYLVSAIMLYEDVDFKTISDRYTKSRMLPFLTHIDGVRANLFSINPRQKMTALW